MRKIMLAVMGSAVLAACGGGGGDGGFKDPNAVTFTYGTPTAASGSALTAADSAQSGIASAASMQTSGGASDADLAGSVAGLPADLGDILFDTSMPYGSAGLAAAKAVNMPARAVALARGNLVAASSDFDPACVTVTDTAVTFQGCTSTASDSGLTVVVTLNGSMTRGPGHVSWDAALALHATGTTTDGTVDVTESERMRGDITVAAAAIQGYEQVDLGLAGTAGGQSDSAKVTFRVDLDLSYLGTPSFCLTGGTVTAKLVWTQRPRGASATDLPDAAVQLTWQDNAGACSDSVLVAWGTAN